MEELSESYGRLSGRLADILQRLYQGERLSPRQLADEYGVNLRTIQRDLLERFAYLPLKKDNGNFYLESFNVGKLTEQDIRNFAALAGLKGMFPNLDNRFLRNLLDSRISAVYEVKQWPHEDATSYQRLMDELKDAILRSAYLECRYDGKARTLQPYKLVNHNGRWYLAAVEKGQSHPKAFRLAKLDFVHVLPDTFTPSPEVAEQVKDTGSIWFGDTMEVVLTIAKEVAGHFRDRQLMPGQQIIKELGDGGLIVASHVVHEAQILPIVRFWMPHVRIVSPENIRDACMESIRQYVGQERVN